MAVLDYIVVGSGCSGAIAAQTLIKAGATVTMLDVGVTDETYAPLLPEASYIDLRQTEADQYRYLIGNDGEGIAWGNISKGAQVTPPRMHINRLVDTLIPMMSDTFSPLESLGYGGLGIGWGLQCWTFSKPDMQKTGLHPARMAKAYETVAQHIGISASRDDAASYTIGGLKSIQPSPTVDRNHAYIQERYNLQRDAFKHRGVHVGRTPLAMITEDLGHRKAYGYGDMDFYGNAGLSAWRPWVTVDELRKQPNFTYVGDTLVLSFEEKDGVVTVNGLNTKTNQKRRFQCRKLILASGALGSARLALRSLGGSGIQLPLLSNPHAYIPCLQPAMVGQGSEARKLSLGQMSYFIDPTGTDEGLSVASSYSYQSLMLFRVINQLPFNLADSRALMRYLMTGLVIMIAQHPDESSPNKFVKLVSDTSSPTGDKLFAHYSLPDATERLWDERERAYAGVMRKLRTYPLKRVHPPHGSAIHYAGTLPFSKQVKDFSLSPSGRIHGTRSVYVADSSGFTYLPAKGLTFSLMANANLTAEATLNGK